MDILYAEYERYLRQLYIDRSANDYSIYIIILFIVIEFLGTKVLGLPLTGYTINQLSMMHRYERLLIELGEKNYSGMGTGWPVEIRIILLSLFNAFVFLLVTSLCSHMGPEVANLALQWINGFMNGQPNRSSAPASAPAPGAPAPNLGPAGVPTPPAPSSDGGFNLSSIINGLGSLMGGGNRAGVAPAPAGAPAGDGANRRRASRRPTYVE